MPNFAPKGLAADLLQFMLQLEVQFDIYNLHWPNPSCKRGPFIITHSHGFPFRLSALLVYSTMFL